MKSWIGVLIVVILVIVGGLIYYALTLNPGKSPATTGSNTPSTGSNTHNIEINNMAFFPTSLTIHPGETVTWTNKDSVPHTVVSDSGTEISSSSLSTGKAYLHTFNTAGTYKYHCSIHPSMKATIIVQ